MKEDAIDQAGAEWTRNENETSPPIYDRRGDQVPYTYSKKSFAHYLGVKVAKIYKQKQEEKAQTKAQYTDNILSLSYYSNNGIYY